MDFLIKICGITTPADAEMAARAGAGAIGINFWPGSKRFVTDATAAAILAALPPAVLKFGVFVNATAKEVVDKIARLGLDRAQLHGDERPADFVALSPSRLVRAIRVRDAGSLADAHRWQADLFIYDAFGEGYGGTGTTAPWSQIGDAGVKRPFLLAGGLTPDNVGAAIVATRPAGVDVASGVELFPGRKDAARVRSFILAARTAAAGLAGERTK
jgi:phosphoribosylanthranilate isomerase